ncbi:MAG: spore coat protein [Ruminococcaceae bacterium]|nr:spore coat protein [Oscillospiraceae bacterium]
MSLTEKERMALDESLASEKLLIKKCRVMAEECRDGELKALCNQLADKHQQHFNILIGYLQ